MSRQVQEMFSQISGKYDLLNDILSFGIHRIWRKKVVNLAQVNNESQILDCASGTGDLAIAFKSECGPNSRVVATDFCEDMLVYAKEKSRKQDCNIEIAQADAMSLQFKDNEFDLATISFGIRNVDDPVVCLKEMARVVKPGGKVIVLEFGQPYKWFQPVYGLYSQHIMPTLGRIFAGAKSAYTYLPRTASVFPCRESFIELMNRADCFKTSKYYTLSLGIAYIYVGIVKE